MTIKDLVLRSAHGNCTGGRSSFGRSGASWPGIMFWKILRVSGWRAGYSPLFAEKSCFAAEWFLLSWHRIARNPFISYYSIFQQDSGVIKFLQGYSLSGNVTADDHRSFTGPEAQNFLMDVLSRDKTFESPLPAGSELVTEKQTAGMTKILVLAAPNDLTL